MVCEKFFYLTLHRSWHDGSAIAAELKEGVTDVYQ